MRFCFFMSNIHLSLRAPSAIMGVEAMNLAWDKDKYRVGIVI